MRQICLLIPSFNEAEQLPKTLEALPLYLPPDYAYEFLIVDDGSTDRSWEVLKELSLKEPRLRALKFSRNFGKEAALAAGLTAADADAVIVMDCDLQHPPRYLPEMIRLWEEGGKIIEGVKADRGKENGFARFSANCFYRLFSFASGLSLRNASDFKLLDRQVVEVWRSLPERDLFFRGLSAWLGFERREFLFEVDARQSGESKWSLKKLFTLSLDAVTGFSAKPLFLIAALGLLLVCAFLFLGLQTFLRWLSGHSADGFTTVILLQLLIGGSVMLSLGLIGIYIGRIYEESKARPRWIISERLGALPAAEDGTEFRQPEKLSRTDVDEQRNRRNASEQEEELV